jgi:hypothetical protein
MYDHAAKKKEFVPREPRYDAQFASNPTNHPVCKDLGGDEAEWVSVAESGFADLVAKIGMTEVESPGMWVYLQLAGVGGVAFYRPEEPV